MYHQRRCMQVFLAHFLVLVVCGDASSAPRERVGGSFSRGFVSRYNPSLGVGVNFAEDITYTQCIRYNGLVSPGGGLERRPYHESRIRSQIDLSEQMGIEASVQAKGLWGSGGAKGGYFRNVQVSEDNFYWLVNARYDMATEAIDTDPASGFDLTERAKKVLAEEGVRGFYEQCGTHFYTSRKLGAHFSLLYEIHNRSNKVAERMNAEANYSGFGWDASASFQNFIQSAQQDNVVSIHSMIMGGDSSIVEYPDDPTRLRGELEKLRTSLEHKKKGVVLDWGVQSYNVFPEVRAAAKFAQVSLIEDNVRNDALRSYFSLYSHNVGKAVVVNRLLAETEGEEPLTAYSPDDMNRLNDLLANLHAQNAELARRARGCMNGAGDCGLEDLSLIVVLPPGPRHDYRGLQGWHFIAYPREGSNLYMDLKGYPPPELGQAPTRGRYFDTRDTLWEPTGASIAWLRGNNDQPGHEYDYFHIGNFDQRRDPKTGRTQINLCMGDFSKVCNLRFIQNRSAQLEDGTPAGRLQLTVFDTDGFIQVQYNYLMYP